METARAGTPDVVGLGVSTLDLFMVVEEFPTGEEVQRAAGSLLQGGGPVATAMVTLSRLGCPTAMIDNLGDDWRGRLIVSEFRREGVSTACVGVQPGRTSSIATVLVRRRDGARTIVYAPGDADEVTPADLDHDLISGARILHLNGRHFEASLAAAEIAKRYGVAVSFDGGAHRFQERLGPLLRLTDICIVARQFASAFSGAADLAASAEFLLRAGPGLVAITGGSEGSWVFDRSGWSCHQPAFDAGGSVDTTGAGDAYHGGFLYGILNGYHPGKCAEFASAVAALNTRELGGRSALPSLEQTAEFLAKVR